MAITAPGGKMTHFGKIAAAAVIALGAGTVSAYADSCSGHSHDTGTAVGAVGGGLIGGLASHSVVGGLAGAAVGGLAGNAIARGDDCNHHVVHRTRYSYVDHYGHRHYAYR
jgi:Glycine zipper